MKNIFISLVSLLIGLIIGALTMKSDLDNNSKTDLPEEYKLITKDTPIRGCMNKDSVLVIEFVHK